VKKAIYLSLASLFVRSFRMFVGYLKRGTPYEHDAKQDYIYNFDNTAAEIRNLLIEDCKINIDGINKTHRTCFIELRIHASLAGRFFLPSIVVTSSGLQYFQYFEKGASGLRYLNISSFFATLSSGELQLDMQFRHLCLQSPTARLLFFDTMDVKHSKVMVVAPHPDDAEIAAYGIYKDSNAHIVTVTAGDGGDMKYKELYDNAKDHFLKKGKLRVWDSLYVPALAGIGPERAVNLGYFDNTLSTMYQKRPNPVPATYSEETNVHVFREMNTSPLLKTREMENAWPNLVNDFKALIEQINPDVIATPSPALDSHDDHLYTSLALFEALRQLQRKNGKIFLYSNHNSTCEHYPFGAQGTIMSLPPNFDAQLFFRSVYSHHLSISDQKDKFFSIETMHDLRYNLKWSFISWALNKSYRQLKEVILDRDFSYFRRGIRSNELFFVINTDDVLNDATLQKLFTYNGRNLIDL